jgi:hypothetical protein
MMMIRFARLLRPESGLNMLGGAFFLALTMLLAVVGFDLAVFLARAHNAQWEAEGMALAAAGALRETGSQEDALRAARDWVLRNNVDPSRVECCTFGDLRPLGAPDGRTDTVTAAARASQGTFFLHLLGIPGTVSVRRSAVAQVVGAGGGPICPWGVVGDEADLTPEDGAYLGLVPGRIYAIDLAAAPRGPGDFLPLDLSGTGIAGYEEAIARGCRADEAGVWSAGDVSRLLPSGSDVVSSTLQALNDHYSFESADGVADYLSLKWCDVDFQLDGEDPGVGHTVGFSPYLQTPRSECIRGTLDGGAGRIVLVPVVSRPPDDPGGAVRILGLATMYIVSWDRADSSSAGTGEVYGMFLSRSFVDAIDLVGEDDNPLAPLRVVLLH